MTNFGISWQVQVIVVTLPHSEQQRIDLTKWRENYVYDSVQCIMGYRRYAACSETCIKQTPLGPRKVSLQGSVRLYIEASILVKDHCLWSLQPGRIKREKKRSINPCSVHGIETRPANKNSIPRGTDWCATLLAS